MNATRFLKLIFVSALLIVALVALQACTPIVTASGSGPTSAGVGDLERFEAQAWIADRAVETNGPSYAGMGDLHLFEAQNSSVSYSGMGDLHRFEAGQEILIAGERSSPSP